MCVLPTHGRQVQFVPKDVAQVLCHLLLLRHAAVVLQRQDHGVPAPGRQAGAIPHTRHPADGAGQPPCSPQRGAGWLET